MSFSKFEQQHSTCLPSQTVVNPKETINAIHLRSGRKLEGSLEAEKLIEGRSIPEVQAELDREYGRKVREAQDKLTKELTAQKTRVRPEERGRAHLSVNDEAELDVENFGDSEKRGCAQDERGFLHARFYLHRGTR